MTEISKILVDLGLMSPTVNLIRWNLNSTTFFLEKRKIFLSQLCLIPLCELCMWGKVQCLLLFLTLRPF